VSATPSDEEIRRRLERQVMEQVLDSLARGASRGEVIDALVADGFAHAKAEAYVDRVLQRPECRDARRVTRRGPGRWTALFGWGRG
jgi:cytochrome c-type biogenesis protein CcmH/NrfF